MMRNFYQTIAGLICGACMSTELRKAGICRVESDDVKDSDRCASCGAGKWSGA